MKRSHVSTIGLAIALTAGLSHGSDRIVIVLDTSATMWDSFQAGQPRIVAVRTALTSMMASPALAGRKTEVGLRTGGGASEPSEVSPCDTSRPVIEPGPVDPSTWSATLAGLSPGGPRSLARAVREAAHDLGEEEGERRIVVITSGADQCWGDISGVIDELGEGDRPIPVRFVGLEVVYALVSTLVAEAPTRNVTDPSTLLDTLSWAMFPTGPEVGRSEWLELHVSRGGELVDHAAMVLLGAFGREDITTPIENGHARVRAVPGIYRATINGDTFGEIELSDVMHRGRDAVVDLELSNAPPVTLEADPEHLLAGEDAYIQFWGAPAGANWVEISVSGSWLDEFLTRASAVGASGEVVLTLPEAPIPLEVRFVQDIGSGIQQGLGRIPLETVRRRVSIQATERVENRTQLTVTWDAVHLPGDHITITPQGGDEIDNVLCVPASVDGSAAVDAPSDPGSYVIRYTSKNGRTLARSDLEVFEILATLDGPTEVYPGDVFSVSWTGPDAGLDFLSIAAVTDKDDQYLGFTPTSSGSPASFTAPTTPGDYEVRYVRASDGEVLARQPLAVRSHPITLVVPSVVEAGTRFEVEWSGSASPGDFISIAHPRSGAKRYLDWSFTSLGSPVTLAAPFDPGRYVVRYVRAGDHEILAHAPIEVR